MGIGISLGAHYVTAVSSTRQLQAISLPASKLWQYNPSFTTQTSATSLSYTTGLHEGWVKFIRLKNGKQINVWSHHVTLFIFK